MCWDRSWKDEPRRWYYGNREIQQEVWDNLKSYGSIDPWCDHIRTVIEQWIKLAKDLMKKPGRGIYPTMDEKEEGLIGFSSELKLLCIDGQHFGIFHFIYKEITLIVWTALCSFLKNILILFIFTRIIVIVIRAK